MTVGVERKLGMGEVIARLVVGEEALGAGRNPAHRTGEPPRRPRDDALLRIELALVAETAAHIGRDHAQRALGDAELIGDLTADVMGRLGRGVERELPALGLDCSDERARLDRRSHQAVVDDVDRDHMRSGAERGTHRGFVAPRPAKANVAGGGFVQLRRACRLRGARVGGGGQRLVVDRDALGRVGGLRQGLGNDRHHRLADVAHRVAREREARRLGHGRTIAGANRPERPHRRHAVRRHVGAGEHGHDPGRALRRRRIDGADARMRVRRTHENTVQGARQIDIRHEAAAAEQKPAVLHPPQRRADALVVGPMW